MFKCAAFWRGACPQLAARARACVTIVVQFQQYNPAQCNRFRGLTVREADKAAVGTGSWLQRAVTDPIP